MAISAITANAHFSPHYASAMLPSGEKSRGSVTQFGKTVPHTRIAANPPQRVLLAHSETRLVHAAALRRKIRRLETTISNQDK
jgi:hypothetical protein